MHDAAHAKQRSMQQSRMRQHDALDARKSGISPRSLNFIRTCALHDSALISFVARYVVYYIRGLSILESNVLICAQRYNRYILQQPAARHDAEKFQPAADCTEQSGTSCLSSASVVDGRRRRTQTISSLVADPTANNLQAGSYYI